MKNNYLYPCFDKWFEKGGSIWLYSDPHFGDTEIYPLRGYIDPEKQVKLINSKCGKNDTLIILGDIGNIEYVKKLKAGYKVLILGNHDRGKSYYQRITTKKKYLGYDKCAVCGSIVTYKSAKGGFNYFDESAKSGWCRDINCICERAVIKNYEGTDSDNKLFDEVYDGCLFIKNNIILSHEPIDFKYAFNIHGHDHSLWYKDLNKLFFSKYDCDLPSTEYFNAQLDIVKENNLKNLNVCCEWTALIPVNLKDIIKSGVLKNLPDIHRDTIDSAVERKENKN